MKVKDDIGIYPEIPILQRILNILTSIMHPIFNTFWGIVIVGFTIITLTVMVISSNLRSNIDNVFLNAYLK